MYRHHKLLSIIVYAFTLILFLGTSSTVSVLSAQDNSATAVAAQGGTRVIVGLKVSFQAEGILNSIQSITAQRASIQQAQSQLLTTISGYDPSSIVNFKTIPYMVVSVDAAGLQALRTSALATSIQEDRPLEFFLDSSTQLTGATDTTSAGYDGSGQTVAIIDSGVDKYHWFFGGRVVAEGCFSTNGTVISGIYSIDYTADCPNGQTQQTGPGSGVNCDMDFDVNCMHGTHVAGIVAGKGITFNGIAPKANIIAVRITSVQHSLCQSGVNPCMGLVLSNVIEGLEYVYSLRNTYNISSVNLSLGSGDVFSSSCDSNFPAFRDIVNTLTAAKIAVIAASGNGFSTTGIVAQRVLPMRSALELPVPIFIRRIVWRFSPIVFLFSSCSRLGQILCHQSRMRLSRI